VADGQERKGGTPPRSIRKSLGDLAVCLLVHSSMLSVLSPQVDACSISLGSKKSVMSVPCYAIDMFFILCVASTPMYIHMYVPTALNPACQYLEGLQGTTGCNQLGPVIA
jgi:hypothetical protein